jgi:hypothetical protein
VPFQSSASGVDDELDPTAMHIEAEGQEMPVSAAPDTFGML